jgi:hypothetical protein
MPRHGAAGERWELSHGTSFGFGYEPRAGATFSAFFTYHSTRNGFLETVSLGREIGHGLSTVLGVGRLDHRAGRYFGSMAPGDREDVESTYPRVRIVPIALGVRASPLLWPAGSVRPYLGFSPALFVLTWRGASNFTRVEPGWRMGTGIDFALSPRAHLRTGFLYLHSAGEGSDLFRSLGRREFRGLQESALDLEVGWRL